MLIPLYCRLLACVPSKASDSHLHTALNFRSKVILSQACYMETFSNTKCSLFALLTLRNRLNPTCERQTDFKEEKRHLMNSLNNLYLLQLPSRVSSDDFHMDCAAACCSQGQLARGKALAEECCGSSRPASIPPRRSFLHCPVAVGLAASPWL